LFSIPHITQFSFHQYQTQTCDKKKIPPRVRDVLHVYDDTGNPVRTGLDVDGNGVLVPASRDRITDTETAYAQYAGNWWQETKNSVYATDNSGTSTLTGTSRMQVSGFGAEGKIAESLTGFPEMAAMAVR
jgi:hypothetical protein